jgi:DNA-binding transcriptional MerR regulator
MLRYYEQLGLIKSQRIENYSYRVYEEAECLRLRLIIILRKLRISLKQISDILKNEDVVSALQVFKSSINEIDNETDTLKTIRTVLCQFVDTIKKNSNIQIKTDLFDDQSLMSVINSLSSIKANIKTEYITRGVNMLEKAQTFQFRIEDIENDFMIIGLTDENPENNPEFWNIGEYVDKYRSIVQNQVNEKWAAATHVQIDSKWRYIFGSQVTSLNIIPEKLRGVKIPKGRFLILRFNAENTNELFGSLIGDTIKLINSYSEIYHLNIDKNYPSIENYCSSDNEPASDWPEMEMWTRLLD